MKTIQKNTSRVSVGAIQIGTTLKAFKIVIIIITFCFNYNNADATTYYISAGGNDANNGTLAKMPWRTLSKLNTYTGLISGDSVLFNRGETFYGSIIINKSGRSGKPIVFGAYGTGAKPIITGFTTVNSWRNLGSNIWESASAISTLASCNMVVINGANTPMGRYPNTGWLTYQSHSGTTSITSRSLTGIPNWTGATVVMRSIQWMLEVNTITSQSGATLTYTYGSSAGTNGYGFFIQNDERTLDTLNEWYYNPFTKKLKIYNTVRPTNVQVSTIDELVLLSGLNYITFDSITFEGANSTLLENRNSKNIIIQDCSFLFSGQKGIYINGKISANESMTVSKNVFKDNNENAMLFSSYTSKIWVKNNIIKNTGMIPGAGTNSQYSGDAMNILGPGSIAEYNTINNTGHIAIEMRQNNNLIARYNYITYFGMTRYDAGGIYSWNQDSTSTTRRIIDHNIVLYSKQTSAGIGTDTPSLFGIYLDGDSKNTAITNNTVAHCYTDGILILNSGSIDIINNTCFDNGNQLAFIHAYGTGMKLNNIVVKNNTFLAKNNSQITFNYRDDDGSFKFGTADSNYYARPIDDNLNIVTQISHIQKKHYTLKEWQIFSGCDAKSRKSLKSVTNTSELRFEYNATMSSETISLDGKYVDTKGIVYNESITLPSYTSIILYRLKN